MNSPGNHLLSIIHSAPYEGGIWNIKVEIPERYPYKSPSIGTKTHEFHLPDLISVIIFRFHEQNLPPEYRRSVSLELFFVGGHS